MDVSRDDLLKPAGPITPRSEKSEHSAAVNTIIELLKKLGIDLSKRFDESKNEFKKSGEKKEKSNSFNESTFSKLSQILDNGFNKLNNTFSRTRGIGGNPKTFTPDKDIQLYPEATVHAGARLAAIWGGIEDSAEAISAKVNLWGRIFQGVVESNIDWHRGMRAVAFETENISSKTPGMQEDFLRLETSAKKTGRTIHELMSDIMENTRAGHISRKETEQVIENASFAARRTGMNAKETSKLFHDWHTKLNLSTDDTAQMARNMKDIAVSSKMSGSALLEVARASTEMMKALRNAVLYSNDTAKNIIGMMASAKKFGVEQEMQNVIKGSSGAVEFYTKATDQQRVFLVQISSMMGKRQEMLQGTWLKSRTGRQEMAEGMEKFVQQKFGVDLNNMKDVPVEQLSRINLVLESMSGMQLGQWENMVKSLKEQKSLKDLIAEEEKLKAVRGSSKEANEEFLQAEGNTKQAIQNIGMGYITEIQNLSKKKDFGLAAKETFKNIQPEDRAELEMTLQKTGHLKGGLTAENFAESTFKQQADMVAEQLGKPSLSKEFDKSKGDSKEMKGLYKKLEDQLKKAGIIETTQLDWLSTIDQSIKEFNDNVIQFFGPYTKAMMIGMMVVGGTMVALKAFLVARTLSGIKDWVGLGGAIANKAPWLGRLFKSSGSSGANAGAGVLHELVGIGGEAATGGGTFTGIRGMGLKGMAPAWSKGMGLGTNLLRTAGGVGGIAMALHGIYQGASESEEAGYGTGFSGRTLGGLLGLTTGGAKYEGGLGGWLGAAGHGAGTGALIGSIFGPPGMAVGAALGGLAGTIGQFVKLLTHSNEENEKQLADKKRQAQEEVNSSRQKEREKYTGSSITGSFASGTSNVEQSGLAVIHKGETVLDKQRAGIVRNMLSPAKAAAGFAPSDIISSLNPQNLSTQASPFSNQTSKNALLSGVNKEKTRTNNLLKQFNKEGVDVTTGVFGSQRKLAEFMVDQSDDSKEVTNSAIDAVKESTESTKMLYEEVQKLKKVKNKIQGGPTEPVAPVAPPKPVPITPPKGEPITGGHAKGLSRTRKGWLYVHNNEMLADEKNANFLRQAYDVSDGKTAGMDFQERGRIKFYRDLQNKKTEKARAIVSQRKAIQGAIQFGEFAGEHGADMLNAEAIQGAIQFGEFAGEHGADMLNKKPTPELTPEAQPSELDIIKKSWMKRRYHPSNEEKAQRRRGKHTRMEGREHRLAKLKEESETTEVLSDTDKLMKKLQDDISKAENVNIIGPGEAQIRKQKLFGAYNKWRKDSEKEKDLAFEPNLDFAAESRKAALLKEISTDQETKADTKERHKTEVENSFNSYIKDAKTSIDPTKTTRWTQPDAIFKWAHYRNSRQVLFDEEMDNYIDTQKELTEKYKGTKDYRDIQHEYEINFAASYDRFWKKGTDQEDVGDMHEENGRKIGSLLGKAQTKKDKILIGITSFAAGMGGGAVSVDGSLLKKVNDSYDEWKNSKAARNLIPWNLNKSSSPDPGISLLQYLQKKYPKLEFAKGGSFIANGPTDITVGERGPETVSVAPANSLFGPQTNIGDLEQKAMMMAQMAASHAVAIPGMQPAASANIHDFVRTQKSSVDNGPTNIKSAELSAIEQHNLKQITNLIQIHNDLQKLIDTFQPKTAPAGQSGAVTPNTSMSMVGKTTPDYGRWQIGIHAEDPSRQAVATPAMV